jgi:hypothetical protein
MQFTGQVSIASCSNSSVLTPVHQRERKDSIEIQELQRKDSTGFQELQPSKGDMGWKNICAALLLAHLVALPWLGQNRLLSQTSLGTRLCSSCIQYSHTR